VRNVERLQCQAVLFLSADDVAALEDHLKKVGSVQELHNPAPASGIDRSLTDAEKADFLVKLMSHVRLHFLYLAEKLQEQLVAPEGEMATAASGSGQVIGLSISLHVPAAHHGSHGSKLTFLPQCNRAFIDLNHAHGDRGLCGGVNDDATHANPAMLSHLHRDEKHADMLLVFCCTETAVCCDTVPAVIMSSQQLATSPRTSPHTCQPASFVSQTCLSDSACVHQCSPQTKLEFLSYQVPALERSVSLCGCRCQVRYSP